MSLSIFEIESPIGDVTLALDGRIVCALRFSDRWTDDFAARLAARAGEPATSWRRPASASGDVVRRLRDYFAGDLTALDEIEAETGGTPFQRSVWRALRSVPAGRTASYADVARGIGHPSAVRAVGAANGANPVCLIVPCHRIVGSDGSLTGYGGGIERKQWLLAHESGRQASAALAAAS